MGINTLFIYFLYICEKISQFYTFKNLLKKIKIRVPTLWAPVSCTDPEAVWQCFFPFRMAVWSTDWHES